MTIKLPNRPKYLYKYQPCDENSFKNLESQSIWFQMPKHLNDPFDCKNNLVFEFDEGDIPGLIEIMKRESPRFDTSVFQGIHKGRANELYRQLVLEGSKALQDAYADTAATQNGVACFSEVKDNLLMWSHYSLGHQGYCLEFDTSFDPFTKAFQVEYRSEFPKLNVLKVLQGKQDMLRPLLYSKSSCWRYEKEWRIQSATVAGKWRFAHGCLNAIYFGARITSENKHRIREAIKVHDYYEAEISKTRFALLFRKIDLT